MRSIPSGSVFEREVTTITKSQPGIPVYRPDVGVEVLAVRWRLHQILVLMRRHVEVSVHGTIHELDFERPTKRIVANRSEVARTHWNSIHQLSPDHFLRVRAHCATHESPLRSSHRVLEHSSPYRLSHHALPDRRFQDDGALEGNQ